MSRKSAEAKYVAPETSFEKFIRVLMMSVRARGLLKEIVRVHALPADDGREAELARLCRMAQEELDAPPRFVKIPCRRPLWPLFTRAK